MAKHGKIQTTLEYFAAWGLLSTFGAMPRPVAVAMGKGGANIAYRLARGLRRTGLRNLELAFPEKSERERAQLLRSSFANLGRLIGEFSHFPRETTESLRRRIERRGFEHYKEAAERGRPVILLSGHIGAWEMLSFAISALENPISFIVRPIDNPRVDELVEKFRCGFGNTSIDKRSGMRRALRLLRGGGTLGVLADINTHPREGIFVPFFGHLACTATGTARLALRTDAAVFPICGTWDEGRKRFILSCEPALELVRTGDEERDVATNTALFNEAIEKMIREHPDQYFWIHRRWRTRPEGEPDLYEGR